MSKDYSKVFRPGAILTRADFDHSDDETAFIISNHITFGVKLEDIVEIHLFREVREILLVSYLGQVTGFPVACLDPDDEYITLASAFGSKQENEVMCTKIFVDE